MLEKANPRAIRHRVLSQPDLHMSLETKSRITPNNNRYCEKESSEDDIIQKLSENEHE